MTRGTALLLMALCIATSCARPAETLYPSAHLVVPGQLGFLPKEGDTVTVNPPPLAWLQEPEAELYDIQISTDVGFSSTKVISASTRYLIYTHTQPLEPGTYYWRYRYSTASGAKSHWSAERSFCLPCDAVRLPRPSIQELAQVIPPHHPRVMIRPEQLEQLRKSPSQLQYEWELLKTFADNRLTSPIMQQPKPWTGNDWNAPEWMRYYGQITSAAATVEALAFTYLVSHDRRYGERARQWLLAFASWDPLGPTSISVNDEQAMVVLSSGSRAYSWIHDLLTTEDIQKIRASMRVRGNDALKHLRKAPYEQFPYDSHSGRIWHFLAETGLAFYDEIPEAADWLDYGMTIFYGWYPIWGDADGSWAEGLHYWSSYNDLAAQWLEQMQNVLRLDPARKPYYAHAGDFPLHVAPPGGVLSGFGDFSEWEPEQMRGRVVQAYATMRQNPEWQWYADRIGPGSFHGPIRYLRAFQHKPLARQPADGKVLKVFSRAGWAVFNSSIADPTRNVQLMLRASPYGNISHSHNDQNNIVLAAFGSPLLVNTGTRDYYGSPFCKEWYWATRAHNCVLLGNQEQARGWNSASRVCASGEQENGFAWAVGDAGSAYSPPAQLCRRWVTFAPEGIITILDEVQTSAPSVSLLFHGRAPFTFSRQQQEFGLVNAQAQLHARLFGARQFEFLQSDHYTTSPAPGTRITPEWHLSATASCDGRPLQVLTFMQVTRPDHNPAALPEASVSFQNNQVCIRWKTADSPRSVVMDTQAMTCRMEPNQGAHKQ